jgi:hypothetical protein
LVLCLLEFSHEKDVLAGFLHLVLVKGIVMMISAMQLVEFVEQVLEAGVLPMAVERKLYQLLESSQFNANEMAAVERLIEAMMNGRVQPVA